MACRCGIVGSCVHRCMLVLTLVLLLTEAVIGRLCNSLITMVDCFHTLFILLHITFLWTDTSHHSPPSVPTPPALPPPTPVLEQRCGGRRLRPFGGLLAALLLASLCISISLEIVSHALQPHPTQRPLLAAVVGALSLLLNASVLALSWDRRVTMETCDITEDQSPRKESDLDHAVREGEHSGSAVDGTLMFCNQAVSLRELSNTENSMSQNYRNSERSNKISDSNVPLSCTSDKGHPGMARWWCRCVRVVLTVTRSVLGSVLVLANSAVLLLSGPNCCPLLVYLDPAFSTLTVLVLLATALPEARRHGLLLLQATPAHISMEELALHLGRVPGALAVHELHVWQLAEAYVVASVHVHCSECECRDVVQSVTQVLRGFGVSRCTVQPELVTAETHSAVVHRPLCSLACGGRCAEKMCCSHLARDTAVATSSSNKEAIGIVIENTFL